MGRSIPVILNTIKFPSKKFALAFFKEMLSSYTPGEKIQEKDAMHLASLLKRHSEYDSKVKGGIKHFEVMMSEEGTPCFCIIRNDNTKVDFSFYHCINQR